jgi:phenylalanyl-tRNA synthetase beta chain
MRIALEWLKDFVDYAVSPEELSTALTMGGLEVEADETVELAGGKSMRVVELNVTPNRGYCLSHSGVAREVASLLNVPCRFPDPRRELETVWGPASITGKLRVDVEDAEACSRYSALVIEGVRPGPSPQWLADRLTAVGLRPINNIVDVTNYVLMEYGQPLHAFDAALLAGGRIVVRRARQGEVFSALDGTQAKLDADALVIADADKPVALAGIMGGSNSQVSQNTHAVVLESACFDPAAVRRASKKYGLRSDSSYRFERGIDIEGVITAQARAALLIRELAGGVILNGRIDLYPCVRRETVLPLRIERLNRILGGRFAAADVADLLRRLGFAFDPSASGFQVRIPTHRPGLTREIDLIEEIARLYGYNRFTASAPRGVLSAVRPSAKQQVSREIKSALCHLGYSEAVNYSFLEPEHAERFKSVHATEQAQTIPLTNPISADLGAMRTSVLPSLLKTAQRNLRQGQRPVKLFEVGSVYYQDTATGAVCEELCLATLAVGGYESSVWKPTGKSYDFYDIKGVLESVFAQFRVELEFHPAALDWLAPGKSVECRYLGRRVGLLGELAPALVRQWDLADTPCVAEINLDRLLEMLPGPVRFAAVAKYPATYRDISLVVEKNLPSAEVARVIRAAGVPLIHKVELYDQFEGQKLGAGKKSLTFALAFQSPDRTLTDEEVNPVFADIVKQVGDRCGAVLRD